MDQNKIAKIAKKAKSQRFNISNDAACLYYIMANIGGIFGIIVRNQFYDAIDHIESQNTEEEAFAFLEFLDENIIDQLRAQAKGLCKASFITNEKQLDEYEMKWNLVMDGYKKMRIQTICRAYPIEKLKRNDNRYKESMTLFWTKG